MTAITTRLRVRPAPSGRVLRLYLLTGVAALIGFYALPRDSLLQDTIYYPALGLLSVAAIVAGVAWHRPRRPLPWLLFAAGQLMFVLGDVVFGLDQHVFQTEPFPGPAAALYLLVRQRSTGRDWLSLIDAATVTVALGVVSWELLMVPFTQDDSLSIADKVASVAYPLGDVLLIAVAARLVLTSAAGTVSYLLIGASLLALLIAD